MTERLETAKVGLGGTLADAMRCLEAAAMGIALVVDEMGRLVGTMTDGDVRRALLSGVSMDAPLSPYAHRPFTSVGPDVGRAEVLDLMQARVLKQIPVVDKDGHLMGLHLLHELVGSRSRENWAVIMAGGQGMRLRPITEHLPKPMLRVAGRPILERLVLHLVGAGIRRIFLAIHHLGHVIEDHFQDGARFGCRIEYLRESEPLGTGGALALLPDAPKLPLVVMNGDLVTQARLGDMLDFHDLGGQIATMGVRRYVHQVPFGCVDVEGGSIVRLDEKPSLDRLVNAGVYVLSPAAINMVPRRFFPITELFDALLQRKERVAAFEIEDDWTDVGQREQLRGAREGTE